MRRINGTTAFQGRRKLDAASRRPWSAVVQAAMRLFLLMAAAAIILPGCSSYSEPIHTTYGRRGGEGRTSINGTSVLAKMFQDAGHHVVSRGAGAGNVENCDVIIWAPDNFEPPTEKERALIHDWLDAESGRTFIYIGRDYDAAPDYWQHVADNATGPEAEEVRRRLAVARANHNTARAAIPADEYVGWFVVSRDHPRRQVKSLADPWSDDIDAAKASITLQAHFDVPTYQQKRDAEDDGHSIYEEPEMSHEVLLAAVEIESAEDDPFDEEGGIRTAAAGSPLVTRVTHHYWEDSALVVVTNGSFLLNMPLVNHENRKLAAKLIDECGEAPLKVAFWDGDGFFPSDAMPQHDQWAILKTWPLSIIWFHLGLLGIVFVLWKFPLFGPPRDLPQVAPSDFAKHINALGDLMAATGDAAYARARLQTYAAQVRGEPRSAVAPRSTLVAKEFPVGETPADNAADSEPVQQAIVVAEESPPANKARN